jgi:hypothetical protein
MTLQPVMFVVIFVYMLGGDLRIPARLPAGRSASRELTAPPS